MQPKNDFAPVFDELKNILEPYAPKLTIKMDTKEMYYLDGPYSEKWKKEVFFGSVQIKKNYVSFYLMPVYMFPNLLKDVSTGLKKHMQGKSCFNFKKIEPELFKELADLTKNSFKYFIEEIE
jgi:hypothetical protein